MSFYVLEKTFFKRTSSFFTLKQCCVFLPSLRKPFHYFVRARPRTHVLTSSTKKCCPTPTQYYLCRYSFPARHRAFPSFPHPSSLLILPCMLVCFVPGHETARPGRQVGRTGRVRPPRRRPPRRRPALPPVPAMVLPEGDAASAVEPTVGPPILVVGVVARQTPRPVAAAPPPVGHRPTFPRLRAVAFEPSRLGRVARRPAPTPPQDETRPGGVLGRHDTVIATAA